MTADTETRFGIERGADPAGADPEPMPGSVRALARRTLVFLLFLGLMLLSPGAQRFVVAQNQRDTVPEAAELDDLFARAEEVRRTLDRRSFDLDELAFELAFETPDAIVAWVRENIAFEQYPGLLRGARGTLLARAGNTLDQAVLLATLLRDAGYEAHIAHSRLPQERARELVLQMRETRAATSSLDLLPRDGIRALQAAARDAAMPIAPAVVDLEPAPFPFDVIADESMTEASRLLEVLRAQNAPLGGDVTGELVAEAQDYFWVEYRDGGAAWSAAHPAFIAADPVGEIEPSEIYRESIPARLQHRLRIDVFIEQKLGDRLVIHPLVDGWERPTANLNGVPLTFANVPWTLGSWGDLSDPLAQVMDNGVFVPLFNGEAASGLAFDTNGNVVPLSEASAAAAALFQTVGGAFERAGGGLADLGGGGDDGPEDFVTLTAQWIDYTLIAPGGEGRTIRRTVLDRIGPDARADGSARIDDDRTEFLPLLSSRSAMVATGTLPVSFALDRQLALFADNRSLLEQVRLQAIDYDPEALFDMQGGIPFDAMRPLELLQLIDLAPLPDDVVSYRGEPSLVVIGQGIAASGDETRAEAFVDIISNAKRIYVAVENGLAVDAISAVHAGVWDTHVEASFLDGRMIPLDRFNTMIHVDRARQQGRDLMVLRPEDADRVVAAGFPAPAAANIVDDLAAGYWVLIPPAASADAGRTAWWRIDPATGETLGIIADGRGATWLEYLIVLGAIALLGLLVYLHIEQEECKQGLRGQPGYDLEFDNPREYERQSLGCSYNAILRRAVLYTDRELEIERERCRNNPVLLVTVGCPE